MGVFTKSAAEELHGAIEQLHKVTAQNQLKALKSDQANLEKDIRTEETYLKKHATDLSPEELAQEKIRLAQLKLLKETDQKAIDSQKEDQAKVGRYQAASKAGTGLATLGAASAGIGIASLATGGLGTVALAGLSIAFPPAGVIAGVMIAAGVISVALGAKMHSGGKQAAETQKDTNRLLYGSRETDFTIDRAGLKAHIQDKKDILAVDEAKETEAKLQKIREKGERKIAKEDGRGSGFLETLRTVLFGSKVPYEPLVNQTMKTEAALAPKSDEERRASMLSSIGHPTLINKLSTEVQGKRSVEQQQAVGADEAITAITTMPQQEDMDRSDRAEALRAHAGPGVTVVSGGPFSITQPFTNREASEQPDAATGGHGMAAATATTPTTPIATPQQAQSGVVSTR